MKIDLLDKKILLELDQNSRLSYPQLSRKVHASKEVVAYRIRRLVDQKVISHFYTIISLSTLGYFNYKIYAQLHGLSEEKEHILIQKLKDNKDIVWLATCEGRWDLMISFYAKHIQEFAEMKAKVFEIIGQHIQEYAIIINEDGFILHRDYLGQRRNISRAIIPYLGNVGTLIIDEKERNLLIALATDSRLPITEIANASGYSTKTVIEKIRTLKKSNLIQSFTIGINLAAINYFGFKIFIYLQDLSRESYSSIFNFCKEFPQVRHIIKILGAWELELELETPNPRDLQLIIKKLKNRFPDKIKRIESV